MAKFEMLHGTDDLIAELGEIARAQVAREMLRESAPILVTEMKAKAAAHQETGDMVESIKADPPIATSDGISCVVSAKGTGSNGTRNAEKMAYLEYGTPNMAARPWRSKAVSDAEPKAQKIVENVIKKELELE